MYRVGIIGIGLSEFFDTNDPKRPNYYELSFIATKRALESVGLEKGEVDFFIEANIDLFAGRLISNMYTCTAAGGYLNDEANVAEDGTLGLIYAYMKLRSGFDVALVTSACGGDVDHVHASTTIFDPFIYRPLSMNYLLGLALQASSYKHMFDVKEEYAALIAEKNRDYGSRNPRAFLRSKITCDDVLNSDYVIWPLRELMISPIAAGAVSVVLASEHVARRYTDTPIWIDEVSWFTDGYYLGGKPLFFLIPLALAARKVYNKLNIEKPLKQIDLFEVSDVTAYHELMIYEALRLAPIGRGWEIVKDEGRKVNCSGGSLSTNLFQVSGLLKIAEAYLQLLGEAGPVQVSGAEKALVHGLTCVSGASSQTHSLIALSR